MKNLFSAFVILLLLGSCGENDIDNTYTDYIKGTWQLVEIYSSNGGAGQWSSVADGYTYTFLEDNIVIADKFECEGTYQFSDDGRLTITFSCPDNQFNLTYKIESKDNLMVLTPDPSPCDEGCAEKFKRVTPD
ncbi:hypothetical protein AWW67_03990 [Roseivirga seohaensis]|uniref:Lipocalin-like domain-containing protein n=1 Tax=Roseivirga seohaensis TaxID=1914963 RepID=A0A150XZR2_9BACT|nr:lipocalin family protein [Roseivirga seohaensis]KYG84280.1 hypothetical protein AWW67_03990 [Roseivirga seohaensis]